MDPQPAKPAMPQILSQRVAGAGLAGFARGRAEAGLTDAVLHAAKRVLLYRLASSADGLTQAEGRQALEQACARAPRGAPDQARAGIWWTRERTTVAAATAINHQTCQLHPHGATHMGSLYAPSRLLLPALLAHAEAGGCGGRALLQALATGIEVELAAAAAQAATPPSGADDARWRTAATAIAAAAARCHLDALDAAATARALQAACGDDAALLERIAAQLPGAGQAWRLQALALHCRPAPLIALAPIEAALALRAQAAGRAVARLELALSHQAWRALQARPPGAGGRAADLRHGLAASWHCARFTLDEWRPEVLADPAVGALRERIELVPDAAVGDVDGCVLTVHYADGSSQRERVEAALGCPREPLRDSQLAELFRAAADDLVLPRRAGEILYAVWGLEQAAEVGTLVSLLHRPD